MAFLLCVLGGAFFSYKVLPQHLHRAISVYMAPRQGQSTLHFHPSPPPPRPLATGARRRPGCAQELRGLWCRTRRGPRRPRLPRLRHRNRHGPPWPPRTIDCPPPRHGPTTCTPMPVNRPRVMPDPPPLLYDRPHRPVYVRLSPSASVAPLITITTLVLPFFTFLALNPLRRPPPKAPGLSRPRINGS